MKTRKFLAVILLVCVAILTFASCGFVGESGDVTVVIESRDGEYTVYKTYLENIENKSEGAVGVLEDLSARENDPLSLDMVDSTYGAYINSIGGLTPDTAKGEFISVYTSCEADFGTWEGVGVIEYEGTTLKSSGLGISSMTVTKGVIILFRIETYPY